MPALPRRVTPALLLALVLLWMAVGVQAAPSPEPKGPVPSVSPAGAPASPSSATATPSASGVPAGSPSPSASGAPTPSRPSPSASPTAAARQGKRANPMFSQDRPPLDLREKIFFSALACFVALYFLAWMVRQLYRPVPASEEGTEAAEVEGPSGEATSGGETAIIPEGTSAPPEQPASRPAPVPIHGARAGALELLGRMRDIHVFLFYLLVAIAVTFPAILRLSTHAIGDNESDVWKHLWGYWWVKDSLLHQWVFPLTSPSINAPYGGSLYCIDPLNALVSVPLQLVLPLVTTFNLIVLAQLALGAFGAYVLVQYLTESKAAAIPAGIVYGFSPYVLAYPVGSGVTETLNLAWIPLTLVYWLRTVREEGWRNPLRLAIFVFLTIFGSFYYGAFLMLMLAMVAVGGSLIWLFALARATSDERAAMRRAGRGAVGRLAVGMAVGGVMALLPVLSFFHTLRQPDSIIPPYVRQREEVSNEYMALVSHNYASLVSYVAIGKENLCSTYTSDRLSRASYIGFVVLLWVAIGLLSRGWARRAGLLALFFMLLSLGPYMVVSPAIHLDEPVSPVYLLFYRVVPLFPSIAIPYRMALMVTLFCGIVMGFGIRRVLGSQQPWMQNLMALLISLQILVEFVVASPAPYPAPLASAEIPTFYKKLAGDPDRFSILELPVTRWNTELTPGEYFLYQTVHKRPIPYTISGTFYQALLGNAFTKSLCNPHFQRPEGIPEPTAEQAVRWLRSNGFRYVAVHRKMLLPEDSRRLMNMLDRLLGPPAEGSGREDEPLRVYRVTAPVTKAGVPPRSTPSARPDEARVGMSATTRGRTP